jgi:hypothetical protein
MALPPSIWNTDGYKITHGFSLQIHGIQDFIRLLLVTETDQCHPPKRGKVPRLILIQSSDFEMAGGFPLSIHHPGYVAWKR